MPSRRRFLAGSAGVAGLLIFGRSAGSAEDTVNLGIVGAGGRGLDNLNDIAAGGVNIAALCDVDDARAADACKRFPKAKRYRDWRKMLEAELRLDAVVISTPDHNHAVIAIAAMKAGRHVYCEKPLAHSIYEARRMRQVAEEMKVCTQMGTQGHAYDGTRQAVEVLRSGALGPVKEIHVWTDRPKGWWPQGVDRPADSPPVPPTLDWDVWLGPTPSRPYHPAYVPFAWRGFWDFGTGAIGDMGIHNLDTIYWGLDLGLPATAEVKDSGKGTRESPPEWSIIEFAFRAKGERPAIKMTWYDGGRKPPAELFHGEKIPENGSLAIGTKGTLLTRDWHGGFTRNDWFRLLPRKDFEGFAMPAPALPRGAEHHREWLDAIRGGPAALSNFSYAAVLTESLLLGQLALRVGKKIEWDAKAMKAAGCPEADPYITPEFRKGWSL